MKVMEKTFLFALVFISLKIFAQDNNLDPYQFFPANIGDRWEYTTAGPDVGYTIVKDSIDLKDSSRFIFFRYPPTNRGADYRIDKNYNVFDGPNFDNRHVYKLDAKVGETWMVLTGPTRYKARVREEYPAYVFGKLTTIKVIDLFLLTREDTVITENSWLQYWEKLAYGFGLISREDGATQPFLLRGCRINGVTYGTVDVEEEPKTVPSEFVLFQNYPNPFNPTTTINYQLPENGFVTIKIYDMLGKEIATLVNENKSAGYYKVEFNASKLTSGVYIYTINANNFIQSKKMLLTK